MACELRLDFAFFYVVENNSKEEEYFVTHEMIWNSNVSLCKWSFIGTVTPTYLHSVYQCFCAIAAEMRSCDEDQVTHKASLMCYCLAFCRRSLLTRDSLWFLLRGVQRLNDLTQYTDTKPQSGWAENGTACHHLSHCCSRVLKYLRGRTML